MFRSVARPVLSWRLSIATVTTLLSAPSCYLAGYGDRDPSDANYIVSSQQDAAVDIGGGSSEPDGGGDLDAGLTSAHDAASVQDATELVLVDAMAAAESALDGADTSASDTSDASVDSAIADAGDGGPWWAGLTATESCAGGSCNLSCQDDGDRCLFDC